MSSEPIVMEERLGGGHRNLAAKKMSKFYGGRGVPISALKLLTGESSVAVSSSNFILHDKQCTVVTTNQKVCKRNNGNKRHFCTTLRCSRLTRDIAPFSDYIFENISLFLKLQTTSNWIWCCSRAIQHC